MSLLVGVLEATSVATIYPLLATAFEEGFEGGGNFILSAFNWVAALVPTTDPFIGYSVIFVLVALLAFVAKSIFIIYRTKFSTWLVETEQNQLFNKYLTADYQFFTDHKQGELIYNVGRAPLGLSELLVASTGLVSEAALSVSILIFLFSLSLTGTLIVISVGAAYLYLTRYVAKTVSYQSAKGELSAIKDFNVILNELLSGIHQIKVFCVGEDWSKRFSSSIKKRWHHARIRALAVEFSSPVLILIMYISIGLGAISIRILFPADLTVLIPVFGTFAFAVFRLVPVAAKVSGLVMNIMGAVPDCELFYSILDKDINKIKDGKKELESFQSEVQFDNVTYAYEGRGEVLKDVSVKFEKGKTTAIVGRSGSGKTTVVNLILRLFDVEEGEVRIDGTNIKDYRVASLRDKTGFVSQDAFTFNDTIRNNITFGLACTDEKVVRAAKYAAAHSFVSELPDGYETIVGDKGMKLSGGQRQRIAVARAMLREPQILIFDEATNSLDNISESAVQKAIEELSKDHTVIIIAHRLSTIMNADKIIVLESGRVLEEGTHQDLIRKKGAYWKLHRSQPVEEFSAESSEEILGKDGL